jgi:translation initiation factor IF-3
MIKRIIKERKHRINSEVRYDKVRLIEEGGSRIMSSLEASILAKNSGLDLILINDKSDPPIVRIEEYSKFLYHIEKQEKLNKKKQKASELKEIQLSPDIADNDLGTKSAKAKEFLEKGNKVKVLVILKGRQKAHPERGELTLLKFVNSLEEFGDAETFPKYENFRYNVILKPRKKIN